MDGGRFQIGQVIKTSVDSLEGRLTVRLEIVPGDSVLSRAELAARSGFDGIAFPGRFRDQFGDESIRVLSELPIPFTTVSLGFEGSLCSPDPEQRKLCHNSLLELFDFAETLGASSVNVPPVLTMDNPNRFPVDEIAAQDQLLIQQLPVLGDQAANRGLKLLIEPVNQSESEYLHSVAHAAEICAEVNHPAIGLTPDFFHMQKEEPDIAAALTAARPWIHHLHTAEHNRVEPGPGTLDFRPGFRALKESGYDGLVEVECRSLSGPAETVLPATVEYLKREWILS